MIQQPPSVINQIASFYAGRPVTVSQDPRAWLGQTNFSDNITMRKNLYAPLRKPINKMLKDPWAPWAMYVLAHEIGHLVRGEGKKQEGWANQWAMNHFLDVAQRFGYNKKQAKQAFRTARQDFKQYKSMGAGW
jgi:hypothetical protein